MVIGLGFGPKNPGSIANAIKGPKSAFGVWASKISASEGPVVGC